MTRRHHGLSTGRSVAIHRSWQHASGQLSSRLRRKGDAFLLGVRNLGGGESVWLLPVDLSHGGRVAEDASQPARNHFMSRSHDGQSVAFLPDRFDVGRGGPVGMCGAQLSGGGGLAADSIGNQLTLACGIGMRGYKTRVCGAGGVWEAANTNSCSGNREVR